jgi:predicted nucleic-acid-binding protein
MKIVDANIILRYLLNDTEDLSSKAANLLENNAVMVPNEVIAEIVYVLEKVYKVKSEEISSSLMELFDYDNLQVNDHEILVEALTVYSKQKLDFVDALLYAYHKVGKHEVYTFDKKLNKLLNS